MTRAAGKSQAKQVARKRVAATSRTAKPRVKRGAAKSRAASPKPSARRGQAAPPAFAVQRAGATAREHLLFELQRARTTVKAALQGLTPASAMRPVARGKWSPLEIVLHLSERDRVRLGEIARTLAGRPRTWAGIKDPKMAAVNEAHLAPLRAHTWNEAVRRLDSLREELLVRMADVPAEPDDVWKPGHAFGDMMWGLPEHDRHHAEQIKRARGAPGVPIREDGSRMGPRVSPVEDDDV